MKPILYESNETAFTSNGLGRLRDCISCVVTEERNGIYECDFEYPITGANYDKIKLGRIIAVEHDDTNDLQPFDIVSYSKPIAGVVTFHAVHISYRQSKLTAVGTNINSLASAFTMLGSALPENPFSYETNIESTAYMASADGTPRSVRQFLGGVEGSILDTYGGEYEWDKFRVILHKSRGAQRSLAVRYGVNMSEYNEDTDYSGTYTAVVPYWTGGDSIIVGTLVESGNTSYDGHPNAIPLDLTDKFENQPTTTELEAAALSYMNSHESALPSSSVSVSFIQLENTNEYDELAPLLKCRLCDSIKVVFPHYNTSRYMKIVKTVYNVLLERYESLELGTLSTTLSEALGVSQSSGSSYSGGGGGGGGSGETYSLSISGHTITLSGDGGTTSSVTVPDNNTTYTLSISDNTLTLTPSTGAPQTVTVPDSNTTYSISISDHAITLTPSEGSAETITVPDDNTTYTLTRDGNSITLTPSSGTAQSIVATYYATCSTAAATSKKEVTVDSSFSLESGARIVVYMTHSNTVSNPTLSVNGGTAHAIRRYGTTAAGTSAAAGWNAGQMLSMTYSGSYWYIENWLNTTYSTITDAEYQAGTSTSSRLVTPARLKNAILYHAPVESVNGQTGAVTVSVPTKTSELANDSLVADVEVDGVSVVTNHVAEIDLAGKVDEIVQNLLAIESYYRSYLPSKVTEINNAITANPDVSTLFVFTDYHYLYQDQSEGNATGIGNILKYLAQRTTVKDMAFLGDALSYENNSDRVDESINSFLAEVTGMDRMMIVKGNHDLNPYGTPKLTNQQYIDRVMSAMDGNYGIDISDKTWYYRDDTENMVRYIVLDSRETSMDYDYANGDATEKAYITAEAQFFGNTLLSMPSGYMAVVLTHAQWWGTSDTSVTIYSASNQEPVKMMKAYNSRGSYSGLGVSFNFSSGVGTAPVMWVGHAHKDFSQMFGSVLCVSTSADSWAFANARPDYVTHTKGTITEHVADCLLIDRTAGTIDTIRIGAGKNRHFVLGQGQECNVSNSLVNCSTSNVATKAYSTYSATLTADSGCEFDSVVVTVGGFDVSANYVTMGTDTATISIPNVPQDIVVTAHASVAQRYTNLIPQSTEVSSSSIYNGGLGYKNGHYISSGNESANANDCMTGCIPYVIGSTQPTDVIYIKGYTGGVGESHTRLCIRKSDKTRVSEFNGFLNANNIFDVTTLGTGYYKLTPKTGIHNSYTVGYVQFSFHQPDASGIIITKNEPIE